MGSDVDGDGGGMLVNLMGSSMLIGIRTQSVAFLETLDFAFMDGDVRSAEIIAIEWPEKIDDLNRKTE